MRKLLPKIEEITVDRHMNTHTETKSKYFDGHGHPSQSEESECMWTHDKDGITVSVCLCVPVLWWSLQFLVRVFTFLSLILWGYIKLVKKLYKNKNKKGKLLRKNEEFFRLKDKYTKRAHTNLTNKFLHSQRSFSIRRE